MIQTSATLHPKEVEGLLCMAPKLVFMGTETRFKKHPKQQVDGPYFMLLEFVTCLM